MTSSVYTVSSVGGLSIRDKERGRTVSLCFNCRRCLLRGKQDLVFYKVTEQTLQERRRTLESNYISDVRGYREPRGYPLLDVDGMVEQPAQKPLNYPLADDQQLLPWLVKDDTSQLKMNRSSQTTSPGLKKLVATMYSEENKHSSCAVLEIVARSILYRSATIENSLAARRRSNHVAKKNICKRWKHETWRGVVFEEALFFASVRICLNVLICLQRYSLDEGGSSGSNDTEMPQ